MNVFDLRGCEIEYTWSDVMECLIGDVSNAVYLLSCGAHGNCDDDIVPHHIHRRLLWASVVAWLWKADGCALDWPFPKPLDNEFVLALHLPVTICFQRLVVVFLLV